MCIDTYVHIHAYRLRNIYDRIDPKHEWTNSTKCKSQLISRIRLFEEFVFAWEIRLYVGDYIDILIKETLECHDIFLMCLVTICKISVPVEVKYYCLIVVVWCKKDIGNGRVAQESWLVWLLKQMTTTLILFLYRTNETKLAAALMGINSMVRRNDGKSPRPVAM